MTDAAHAPADAEILTWVSREFQRIGQKVSYLELVVLHAGFLRPLGTIDELARFTAPGPLAREIEHVLEEYRSQVSGEVRLTVNARDKKGAVIATRDFRRVGEIAEAALTATTSAGVAGSLSVIESLEKEIASLRAQNLAMHKFVIELSGGMCGFQQRTIERQGQLVDHLSAQHLQGIKAREELLDRNLERQITAKSAEAKLLREGKIVDAIFTFGGVLARKFTRGTVFEGETRAMAVGQHLSGMVASLKRDPERAMRVMAILSEREREILHKLEAGYADELVEELLRSLRADENRAGALFAELSRDEQTHLLLVAEAFDEKNMPEANGKSEISVREHGAPAPPPSSDVNAAKAVS